MRRAGQCKILDGASFGNGAGPTALDAGRSGHGCVPAVGAAEVCPRAVQAIHGSAALISSSILETQVNRGDNQRYTGNGHRGCQRSPGEVTAHSDRNLWAGWPPLLEGRDDALAFSLCVPIPVVNSLLEISLATDLEIGSYNECETSHDVSFTMCPILTALRLSL